MLQKDMVTKQVEADGATPTRPRPVSIQRWSVRRVGLALVVLLGAAVVVPMVVSWSVQTDRVDTSLYAGAVGCDDQEALWLMAQAVPSAALVPCLQVTPPGWTLNDVKAGSGFASMVFNTDRPMQQAAVTVELLPSCDLAGATEVSSEVPGARRYLRIDRATTPDQVTRIYVFQGGCVSERYISATSPVRMAADASSSFGFVTRQELAGDLSRRSDGRLRLDP